MPRTRLVPVTVLLTSSLLAHTARAEGPHASGSSTPASEGKDAKDEAVRREAAARYRRAIELFDEGDLKLALLEFRRAHELSPDFRVLYNIAVVLDRLGKYAESVKAYERYLAEGGENVPAARRTEVTDTLTTLRARTARLSVQVQPEDAELTLDGVPLGRGPLTEHLVDAGVHQLVASKAGFLASSQPVELAGGDRREVRLRLVVAPRPKEEKAVPTGAWIAWGVAGGAALAGLGFGLGWRSASSKLDDLKGRESVVEDRRAAADDITTFSTLTFVAGGVAAASAGAALYFTMRRGSTESPTPPSAWLAPSPFGVTGGARF